MSRVAEAAFVIARRDFVAIVWSRTYLLFLFVPVVAMALGSLLGGVTGQADMRAQNPAVAVVADTETTAALMEARGRLALAMGENFVPRLERIAPHEDPRAQALALLADPAGGYTAVFTGSLERPALTGPITLGGSLEQRMSLMLDDARRAIALDMAGARPPAQRLELVASERAAGSAQWGRHTLARLAQVLLFMLTLLLGTMLLSSLVEEKSNKVIEVLAAAVPLDAIFLGKLMGMLASTLVGLVIWGAIGVAAMRFSSDIGLFDVVPAVGWPVFGLLLLLYFATNYLLMGAVFLGIGGQATNVREVQTLSMPITFAQLGLFIGASMVVADGGGWITWAAVLFPLTSPMAMIALAAQDSALWLHPLALLWQLAWTILIIRIGARLFRRTVMKSGSRQSFLEEFAFWKS